MVKTRTMKLGGQTLSVEEEQFETIREEWNQYETASGVIVRVKLVVHKISRVLDGDEHPAFSEDGDPRIAVKHQVQQAPSTNRGEWWTRGEPGRTGGGTLRLCPEFRGKVLA